MKKNKRYCFFQTFFFNTLIPLKKYGLARFACPADAHLGRFDFCQKVFGFNFFIFQVHFVKSYLFIPNPAIFLRLKNFFYFFRSECKVFFNMRGKLVVVAYKKARPASHRFPSPMPSQAGFYFKLP